MQLKRRDLHYRWLHRKTNEKNLAFTEDIEVFKADRNKLFASNEKQIDDHTLMLDMLHSNMSVVCIYQCRCAFKNIPWCGCCSLLIVVAKKANKGTEIQYLCTQGTLQEEKTPEWCLLGTCTYHNYIFKQYSTHVKLITWCL